MPQRTRRPKPTDHWRRRPGTLPDTFAVSRLLLPGELENAHITRTLGDMVYYRRDALRKPATHKLGLRSFLAAFEPVQMKGSALSLSASSS